jgi:hypothetical protein
MVKHRDFVTGVGAVLANCVSSRFAFGRDNDEPRTTSNVGAVPPPGGGLRGKSNYFLYSDGNPITGLSVVIDVTKDIVAPWGFSIQLNGYSPRNAVCVWQQYCLGFYTGAGPQIGWVIEGWPSGTYRRHLHETIGLGMGSDLYNIRRQLVSLPGITLPAEYKLGSELINSCALTIRF